MKSTTKLAIGAAVGLAVLGGVAVAMAKGTSTTGGGTGTPPTLLPDPNPGTDIIKFVAAANPPGAVSVSNTVAFQLVTDVGTFACTGTVIPAPSGGTTSPGATWVQILSNSGASTSTHSSAYDVGSLAEIPLAAITSVQ